MFTDTINFLTLFLFLIASWYIVYIVVRDYYKEEIVTLESTNTIIGESLEINRKYSDKLYNDYMTYIKSQENNKEFYKLVYINLCLLDELKQFTDESPIFDELGFEIYFNTIVEKFNKGE